VICNYGQKGKGDSTHSESTIFVKHGARGTTSVKSALYLEVFSQRNRGPSPSPTKEIPFLGRDQMFWKPLSRHISGTRDGYYALDGFPAVLDWSDR
jgi:hypothetical protein